MRRKHLSSELAGPLSTPYLQVSSLAALAQCELLSLVECMVVSRQVGLLSTSRLAELPTPDLDRHLPTIYAMLDKSVLCRSLWHCHFTDGCSDVEHEGLC